MYNVAEQFTKSSMAGLETLKTAINASFDGVGKLAALNLHTARAVAARNAENFKSLSAVRDLAGLKALQQPMAISAVSQSVAYSRRTYQICSETSNTMVGLFGSQLSQASGGLVAVVDKGRKSAPPVFDFAKASGKMLMAMARTAYANAGQLTAPVTADTPATAAPVARLLEKTA
ncbi:MAG TPA: phasin family protein [Accumulibacter sp.]|uniref:phasin family protein n=1 Tax=Accumulibacter sp. TaxID=2053492 RepID=UPI002CD7659C|nr:phasin family protein [Accumulibacter sp.]HRF71904.1 phasin family protein [Accumulibacter sp.]